MLNMLKVSPILLSKPVKLQKKPYLTGEKRPQISSIEETAQELGTKVLWLLLTLKMKVEKQMISTRKWREVLQSLKVERKKRRRKKTKRKIPSL